MFRYRTRFTDRVYISAYGEESIAKQTYEWFQDSVPGPGPCSHVRSSLMTASVNTPYGAERYINSPSPLTRDPQQWSNVRGAATQVLKTFEWSKLPSSSEFNLISFLGELDDALAVFGLKFWQRLSYGSLTWGVLPLISDLKAVLQTVQNVRAGLNDFAYENVEDFVISNVEFYGSPTDLYKVSGSGKAHYVGRCSVGTDYQIEQWLDVLGFHPDLATAWDLVPMSFLVDYFLPIGSYLEQYRTGWLNSVWFEGWGSLSFSLTESWTALPPYAVSPQVVGSRSIKAYERFPASTVLNIPSRQDVNWSYPSFTEMFNTVYVLRSILK